MKLRTLPKRTMLLYGGVATTLIIALAAVFTLGAGRAAAAPPAHKIGHALMKPLLRHQNMPLSGHNSTLKTSFSGSNDNGDTTDSNPTLSALCQSFLSGPNPYANPAPNVDQINGDTTVGVGSQTGCQAAQNETTIAVNPFNPRNLVAGTNDYRVFNTREGRNDGSGWAYTTFDGGKTWKDIQLPGLTFQTGATGALSDMDSAGDPAIAFGPHNTVYYANLVFSRANNGSGVTVNVSHNGGLTWDAPVIIHTDGVDASGNAVPTNFFNDKEWITADSHSGRVYVTWTHFTFTDTTQAVYAESPIISSTSSNFGATWSGVTQVSPATATFTTGITSFGSGSNPQVGKDGALVVAYETAVCQTIACNLATDHDAIVVARSTNHGATFTNTEVAANFDFPNNADTGRATLTGENFRINSFPQMTIDQDTGRFFITWADDRNGLYDQTTGASIKTNGDVFVVTSGNGKNWSKTFQVGTNADEVYPAIAANEGHVVVTFYTRFYDPTGINLDVAYADVFGRGDDNVVGSALGRLGSVTHIHRITTQSENPQVQFVGIGAVSHQVLQGVFIGDYTAVAMGRDGKFHPCWTDFRGNPGVNTPNQDAYSQSIFAGDE